MRVTLILCEYPVRSIQALYETVLRIREGVDQYENVADNRVGLGGGIRAQRGACRDS